MPTWYCMGMQLTREDRKKRQEKIREWATQGHSMLQIAYWSGLAVASVNNAIKGIRPKQKLKRLSPRQKQKERRLSRLAQKRRDREFEQKHAAWRQTHVTRCDDYPLGVCAGDHSISRLELLELPGDRYACLCLSKIAANLDVLGITADALDLLTRKA